MVQTTPILIKAFKEFIQRSYDLAITVLLLLININYNN